MHLLTPKIRYNRARAYTKSRVSHHNRLKTPPSRSLFTHTYISLYNTDDEIHPSHLKMRLSLRVSLHFARALGSTHREKREKGEESAGRPVEKRVGDRYAPRAVRDKREERKGKERRKKLVSRKRGKRRKKDISSQERRGEERGMLYTIKRNR